MTIAIIVSAAIAILAAFGGGCFIGYRYGSKAAAAVGQIVSTVDQLGRKG